ncbi:MAG: MBL fold metallo-hydrolase [Candidatus Falkowbacteria bacterium]|jgi:L-ascorbate metabolism protein UlaG (beta-lactamase superfamily)|nr:MBL fold metallo-hydrolase [Candidatus Falkowbacteria bacterium]
MYLQYLGQSCFKIQDKTTADGITVVTDPFGKEVGLKTPNFEADIVTISHDHFDHNNAKSLRGTPYIINCAGEYDIKGVAVHGIDSFHDNQEGKQRGTNIIYRLEIDDISVTHLGDLGHTLTNAQLEILVGTDILLIPVGGKYTLDAKQAMEVISQIEPRIVIPMHYKIVGSNIKDIDEVDKFIKEMGLKPTEEERLKINKKDLPVEDLELIVMKVV